jgi:copper chaperone NosL
MGLWSLLVALPLLAACQKAAFAPVALAAEDMCAMCKMAISEKRFAAEFIDRDGQAFKFDDIRCMVDYIKSRQRRADLAATYLMDFDSRQWIKAETAHCVQSAEIKTPMGGGIIAFQDAASAEAAAAKYHGERRRFADFFDGQ